MSQSSNASVLLWCLAIASSFCPQTCRLFPLFSLVASQTWPCLVASAWTLSCSLSGMVQRMLQPCNEVALVTLRNARLFMCCALWDPWNSLAPRAFSIFQRLPDTSTHQLIEPNFSKPERTRWPPWCVLLGVSWYFKISNRKTHRKNTV